MELAAVEVRFTAAPRAGADPSRYANGFASSNATLDRIWYACGYTTQLCTIDPAEGRAWPAPAAGWDNVATVGDPLDGAGAVLVDGAKRDRTIWLVEIPPPPPPPHRARTTRRRNLPGRGAASGQQRRSSGGSRGKDPPSKIWLMAR